MASWRVEKRGGDNIGMVHKYVNLLSWKKKKKLSRVFIFSLTSVLVKSQSEKLFQKHMLGQLKLRASNLDVEFNFKVLLIILTIEVKKLFSEF